MTQTTSNAAKAISCRTSGSGGCACYCGAEEFLFKSTCQQCCNSHFLSYIRKWWLHLVAVLHWDEFPMLGLSIVQEIEGILMLMLANTLIPLPMSWLHLQLHSHPDGTPFCTFGKDIYVKWLFLDDRKLLSVWTIHLMDLQPDRCKQIYQAD